MRPPDACRQCDIAVPSRLALWPRRPRPPNLEHWTADTLLSSTLNKTIQNKPNLRRLNPWVPATPRADGWEGVIVASQHPHRCRRYLLLEDDMIGSGFGFDMKLMALALLVAVAERRVLLHVPGKQDTELFPYVHFRSSSNNITSGRWCDRPPYTLDCMWEPLSHCDPPRPNAAEVQPHYVIRGRAFPIYNGRYWPLDAPVVRVNTSWLYHSQMYEGFSSPAVDAAVRYLFRPRDWVRERAECLMRCKGLVPGRFIAVFLRQSDEKESELHTKLPPSSSYAYLARRVATALGISKVFLQSASAQALDSFQSHASKSFDALANLEMSYTQGHPRSEHDTEGGRDARVAMSHGAVAAVNLHIASKAAAFIGAHDSMWSLLSAIMLHPRAGMAPWRIATKCSGSKVALNVYPADANRRRALVQPRAVSGDPKTSPCRSTSVECPRRECMYTSDGGFQ